MCFSPTIRPHGIIHLTERKSRRDPAYYGDKMTRDQLLIYLSTLLWGFGMSLFIYIQPLYIAELGATPPQIGMVLALSGLIVPLLHIPIGLWADRHGRRPLIRAGWLLGTLATFAIAA